MKYPIPDTALARHIAVVGETGSGKTHDTKTIVEHVVAEGYRVCVLDTIKTDWFGITSSATGKKPGLPFKILGGPRGHIPLHSGAGKAIGQLVGEGKLPLSIIDMADFEPGGPQKFFEHFAQALWKHMRGVLYLVIEEAHELAPKERAGFGAENMAIHWAKKLATGSRTKGIRLIIASQRTQAVHNALLGSCGTLMAHSLSLPADQKPIIDWLKANVRDSELRDTIEEELAFLPQGTAWVCSAKDEFFKKIKFPPLSTFDNTATPDKDADDFEVATAAVDVDELRSIIGDAVKDAEANDPKALKAQIAKLQAELRKSGTASPPPPPVDTAKIFRDGYNDGWRAAMQQAGERAFAARNNVGKAIKVLEVADQDLNGFTELTKRPTVEEMPKPLYGSKIKFVGKPVIEGAAKEVPPNHPRSDLNEWKNIIDGKKSNGELPVGEAMVLRAILQFDGIERGELSTLTDYKRSTRDAYIQRLKEKGYVEVRGQQLYATELGRAALPDFEPLPTGRELARYWLERLPEGESKVLSILIESYPEAVSRTAIDELTGYKRSTRDAYLQRLSVRRLWTSVGSGMVRAAEALF